MRESDWPVHPEIAQGIPPGIVTGKTRAIRQRTAERIGYGGPLTLAEAVEAGRLTAQWAQILVDRWEQASGQTMLRAG